MRATGPYGVEEARVCAYLQRVRDKCLRVQNVLDGALDSDLLVDRDRSFGRLELEPELQTTRSEWITAV